MVLILTTWRSGGGVYVDVCLLVVSAIWNDGGGNGGSGVVSGSGGSGGGAMGNRVSENVCGDGGKRRFLECLAWLLLLFEGGEMMVEVDIKEGSRVSHGAPSSA